MKSEYSFTNQSGPFLMSPETFSLSFPKFFYAFQINAKAVSWQVDHPWQNSPIVASGKGFDKVHLSPTTVSLHPSRPHRALLEPWTFFFLSTRKLQYAPIQ